jgi:hypothetical protein
MKRKEKIWMYFRNSRVRKLKNELWCLYAKLETKKERKEGAYLDQVFPRSYEVVPRFNRLIHTF